MKAGSRSRFLFSRFLDPDPVLIQIRIQLLSLDLDQDLRSFIGSGSIQLILLDPNSFRVRIQEWIPKGVWVESKNYVFMYNVHFCIVPSTKAETKKYYLLEETRQLA
jgi:hypothetical protein